MRGSRWIPSNPTYAGGSGLLLRTHDGKLAFALTRQNSARSTAYLVRLLVPTDEESTVWTVPEIPPHVTYATGHGEERVEITSATPAGGEGVNLWYLVEMTRADHRAAVRALFESR